MGDAEPPQDTATTPPLFLCVRTYLYSDCPFWLWDVGSGGHGLGFPGFLYGAPAIDGPDGGVKLSRVAEQPCAAETVDREVTQPRWRTSRRSFRPAWLLV